MVPEVLLRVISTAFEGSVANKVSPIARRQQDMPQDVQVAAQLSA